MVIQGKDVVDWSSQFTPPKATHILDRSVAAFEPWLFERPLLIGGKPHRCFELLVGDKAGTRHQTQAQSFYEPLLESAFLEGADIIYALGSTPEFCDTLNKLGFEKKGMMVRRRRYLGVSALSKHSNGTRFGMRGVAKVSRQIRNRLIETRLGSESFAAVASIFSYVAVDLELGFDRKLSEIERRFNGVSEDFGILFLRRKVGEANDSYVIFRESVDEKGRRIMTLIDYWTKEINRRSSLWLMGEISLWALAVGFDVIDTVLVQGSTEEKVFMALGGFRKKDSTPILVKTSQKATMPDFRRANLRASDFTVDGFGV